MQRFYSGKDLPTHLLSKSTLCHIQCDKNWQNYGLLGNFLKSSACFAVWEKIILLWVLVYKMYWAKCWTNHLSIWSHWSQSVWSDWAIYCILGSFSKPVATIILPKSPTFLGNFCQGLKIFNFSSEIIFGQLLKTIGRLFTGHTSHNFLYSLPPPLTLVIRIPFVLTRKCTYQSDSIFIPVPVLGKA